MVKIIHWNNARKQREIKLVTTDERRNQLLSEPYNKMVFRRLISNRNEKRVNINKPIYLGLSILEISKTIKCEFWYDYIKPKYQNNAKISYMDTDSFIIHIKTKDLYKDISDDVKKRYDKSIFAVNKP